MNQAPAQVTGVPYGYVSQDTLEWLGLRRGYNELHLRVLENQYDTQHINQVAQEAADKFERNGQVVVSGRKCRSRAPILRNSSCPRSC